MYETYVPIRVERRPPTIAEIVRQKTDDGARIIDFFLDVMEGRVDGAMLCHRIDAAKQLVKYGYKKAADFIAEHRDETCDHCESRKRGPRPRKDASPAAGPLHAGPPHVQGPYGYDFLTMLTEDFFTVLSAVDEDLMIKLLRAQTRDGGTIIDFLDNVMHGREDGFRVNHRISAARELISHILRDEHAFAHAVLDNIEPAPYSIRRADPRVRPLPGSETPSPSTGEGGACPESPRRSEGDSPARPHTPPRGSVGAGLKPALPGAAWEPCNPKSIVPAYPVVVPAKAGTQRGGDGSKSADDSAVPGSSANGALSADEEPVLSLSKEQCSEGTEPTPTTAKLETLPRRRTRTQRRREGNARAAMRRNAQRPGHNNENENERPAPAELTPTERRIHERRDADWHDPDPYGAPIDSTNPGRSPPW